MQIVKGSWRQLAALLAGSLIAVAVLAPRAEAYIYWDSIGSANLDGTNVQTLNNPASLGDVGAESLASDGSHIYFGAGDLNGNGSIGKMNPDGSGGDPGFIGLPKASCTGSITSAPRASAIAISGPYIYWADGLDGTIGRASVNGSGVNEEFTYAAGGTCGTVSQGGRGPAGIAVDGAHIYWTNPDQNTIGRASLGGTGPTQTFVTGAGYPTGITAAGSDIYWVNANVDGNGTGWIGHAQIDSTGALVASTVNQQFIGPFSSNGDIVAITAFGGFIYFDNGDRWVGRATPDGGGVIRHFVQTSTGNYLSALAADSGQANATTTSVSCNPSSLQLLDPQPDLAIYANIKNTARCTVTVRDTSASPTPLAGSVSITEGPTEGTFGALIDETAACTLSPSAALGQASCAVTFVAQDGIDGFVAHASKTVLAASYSGETTHDTSRGTATVPLQTVHACGLLTTGEGSWYTNVCAPGVNDKSGGGSGSGSGGNGKRSGAGRLACHVPSVGGKTLRAAKAAIARAGCKLGKVSHKHASRKKSGRVLSQSPQGGTRQSAGAKVSLTVGR